MATVPERVFVGGGLCFVLGFSFLRLCVEGCLGF